MNDLLPTAPVAPDSGRWKPVQRAYPMGTEVLTEDGWVDIASFYSSDYLGTAIPFRGNGRNLPGYAPKDVEWGQWETLNTFPKLASMNPADGRIYFIKPARFIYYLYDGRLAHVKMKGVDVLSTLFADLWLKPKYSRSWKFVLADDVIRNTHGTANYLLINKFNRDMYGFWSPEKDLGEKLFLPTVGLGPDVEAVSSSIVAFMDSPITVYPKRHAKRERIWSHYDYNYVSDRGELVEVDRVRTDVPTFNVDIEPYHNLIVRRARKDNNPRTLWVGSPIVVGDGLDKSILRVEGIKGAALGKSYSIIRPDYRSVSSDIMKDKG